MINEREWLDSLEPGDEVAIVQNVGLNAGAWLGKVTRVTKTQIVVGDKRFRKTDGFQPGSDWVRQSIRNPRDCADRIEKTKLIEAQNALRKMVSNLHSELTLDQCQRIWAILSERGQA